MTARAEAGTDWVLALVGVALFPSLFALNLLYSRRMSPRQIRAQGVRAGSAAERAGLRDGMAIAAAVVWRGDATRAIELHVRVDSADRRITFLPASEATVPVEVIALPPGCRMGR